jgi:hypothetical protein
VIIKNTILAKYISYIIVLFFAFIFAPFEFIEGDDAQTMMFHLSNYNFQKYQPYSTYHLGFDLLVFFSNKLIGLTYLNQFIYSLNIIAVCLNLFFIEIIFFSSDKATKIGVVLFPVLLVLISPEWLFSSWVIGPPNFALLFSLIGVWIYFNGRKNIIIFSSLFFSLSIFFRFDFLYVYFFLYVYESFFSEVFFIDKAKLFKFFKLGLFIACFTFSLILIGYSLIHKTDVDFIGISTIFNDIINVFKLKLHWVGVAKNSQSGLKSAMGLITFFTPLFFYTTLVGLYYKRKTNFSKLWLVWLLIVVCLSFPFGWYFTSSGTIKRMLFAVPFFILPTIYWIQNLKIKSIDFICALILLLFQFLIGLNIDTSKTAYGPNLTTDNFYKQLKNNKVKERYFFALNSGFAFPTEEGVRPILGFGYSLFDWNKFYHDININYEKILINLDYYTLVDSRAPLFDYLLFKNDFKKVKVEKILIDNILWEIQVFRNHIGKRKIIISISGGSKQWRRDLNILNIITMQKYLHCRLNFALVYSSLWQNKLESNIILIKTPFTGVLLNNLILNNNAK